MNEHTLKELREAAEIFWALARAKQHENERFAITVEANAVALYGFSLAIKDAADELEQRIAEARGEAA